MASKPSTVLVTGAEGALGSVVAAKFAASGCKVVGTYLHEKPKAETSSIEWTQVDLADPASVRKALAPFKDCPSKDCIDTLIHCAGGFRWTPSEQFTDQDFEFLLDANLKSSFHLVRELVPGMKARGFGRIVFVSARATLQPGAGMGPYAASKSGINMLTSCLADELKSAGDITVNAVLPTIIDTPANRKDMPKADFSAWVPAQELAEIIHFLTQPGARSIHGALIPVAGRL